MHYTTAAEQHGSDKAVRPDPAVDAAVWIVIMKPYAHSGWPAHACQRATRTAGVQPECIVPQMGIPRPSCTVDLECALPSI